ncbi:MAG: AAA family ATPase [Nocardioides sp.]
MPKKDDTRLTHGEPLQTQIVRNIRNAVEAGRLRDGEALPSTRDLAEQWGVSVWTITQAMKELATEGLVENRSRSMRVIRAAGGRRREIAVDQPQVILVGGYAGSGKSEFGRVLARGTGWPIIDKDTICRPVVERALEALGASPHDRDSELYWREVRPREYEALIATASENIECGLSVIVTAPFILEFSDQAWMARISDRFAQLGANATVLWMRCDTNTMLTYLRHRGAARDAVKLAEWETYHAGLDPRFAPAGPHTVIENSASSQPLQPQADQLVSTLTSSP